MKRRVLSPTTPSRSGASSCQPGGPNLPAPMISAPMPGSCCCANALSTPAVPPFHAPQDRGAKASREHPAGAVVDRRDRRAHQVPGPRRSQNHPAIWRSCECGSVSSARSVCSAAFHRSRPPPPPEFIGLARDLSASNAALRAAHSSNRLSPRHTVLRIVSIDCLRRANSACV